jgi:nitroreductase
VRSPSGLDRARLRVRAAAMPVIGKVSRWLASAALRIPRGASFYYAFLSRAFDREHYAVLQGQLRYHDREVRTSQGRYLLRRNVHRLEKGLLMRPRRDVFAAEYILETVRAFEAAANGGVRAGSADELQLDWARDVLAEYFTMAGSHPEIDSARERFQSACEGDRGQRVPYRRDLTQSPSVDYSQLAELARRRRSVRWFLQKQITRSDLDRAVAIAAESPSACNRQPFEFRIVDDPDRVRQVAALPLGTPGYRENIPAIVVMVGQLDAFFDERDRHLIYLDGGLAAMSFILALESLGLSSCCINWPDVPDLEKRMASLLGLGPHQRVIMLIAVGYADPEGLVAYSGKRSIDDLRQYEST